MPALLHQYWRSPRQHIIRVNTVDGEVVDLGRGSVGADVDDPDLLTGGGTQPISGIEVFGVVPARDFAPQAVHGWVEETTVLIHPERMLRGRDERL